MLRRLINKMTLEHTLAYLIFILSFAIVTACSELLNNTNTAATLDWRNGENMATANEGNLTEKQKAEYRKDAEKLAVRFINARDSTQTEISEELIEVIYHGLIHIVNSNHPEAEEATKEEYFVHARTPYNPREILVFADSAAPWVDAWRNGQTETGNASVDNLIDRFNFILVDYNELEHVLPTTMATLQSDRAINGYAVGRLFEELEDIKIAGPTGVTDGSDIKILFFSYYLRYTFEYGFGDCPAGCISRHFWYFKVFADGTIEFIEEEGSPLPDGPATIVQ